MPLGRRRLPGDCVRRLAAADLILHAGDFVGWSVLEELRELGPVEGVQGNRDDETLRAALPVERIVEVEGARIAMLHEPGRPAGREGRLAGRFAGCAAVVYGHTHVPQIARAGRAWILNPGSPTERRRAPARSMLELDVDDGTIRPKLVRLS